MIRNTSVTEEPATSVRHPFPRMPYDEVTSTFVRESVRSGRFEDPAYRSYVNDLVFVEWYLTGGVPATTTGISRAGASSSFYRVAVKYPLAFDAVCRDHDRPVRADWSTTRPAHEDHDARVRWAARHRREWHHVAENSTEPFTPPCEWPPVEERPPFRPYRFPVYPYDGVRSTFVRSEISRGSFDDEAYRRYVDRLVYLEAFTREPARFEGHGYPPVRPWRIAARHPEAFDAVRRDLGAPTRAELVTIQFAELDPEEVERREARHARGWRRVRESAPPR